MTHKIEPSQPNLYLSHHNSSKQLKLFSLIFFRCFYNYLTGARIVAGLPAVATTPRARHGPRLPTTTRLRFLLDLHLHLSLALQILCILYTKRSSLPKTLFLCPPALA
jgi:hypothetical protein